MDAQGLNYYERLGVAEDATPEAIKAAHKKMVRQLHPDSRTGPYVSYFDGLLAGVNEAYDVLSDPAKRRKYDSRLAYERDGTRQQEEEQRQQQAGQEQARREQARREEEARQRQAQEEQRRREEEERYYQDDDEYYWEDEPQGGYQHHGAPPPPPPPRPSAPTTRPNFGDLLWDWADSARHLPWRLVGLLLLAFFGALVLYGCASAVWDSFGGAVAQSGGEQKPALSDSDRQAAEKELEAYVAAYTCHQCSADSLMAAVSPHVSPKWWSSPAGQTFQRLTRDMQQGEVLDQEYRLDEFDPKTPGLVDDYDPSQEVRGTAYYSGRSAVNGQDSETHGKYETRLQKTDQGGWVVTYGGTDE